MLRRLVSSAALCLLLLACDNADNTARPPLPGPGPQATPEASPTP